MNDRADGGVDESLAIRARGLVKQYEAGRVQALRGVDLDICRGEFVAICGPSGCGKTTLLNLISAIDVPDAGELAVCGCDVTRFRDGEADALRRETVGLVFQLHNLLPLLTASENVQTPLLGAKVPAAERVQRAEALLRRVGLGDRLNARPPTLSGGERQRVAICRALVNRPSILLADEPTGALDSASGEAIFALLADLRAELGMTLVVVTHDATVAGRAERVIRMRDGRIECDADRPNSPVS
ncbi:MAG: ABC transporter ATP-binding protein [Phycisphaerae bacterium]